MGALVLKSGNNAIEVALGGALVLFGLRKELVMTHSEKPVSSIGSNGGVGRG